MKAQQDAVDGLRPDARIDQHHIAGVYDRIAPVYDLWAWLTESRARARALELAAVEDGCTVLEVAVGTGQAFAALVRANPHGCNIGIDLSAGMLARARRRLRQCPPGNHLLQQGSAFELPLGDATVDVLLNNYMFDLIPFADMDRVLVEFARVLKPGGRLVLVNMTVGEQFGSGIYERLYRLSPGLMGGCRGVRLHGRLERLGFQVLQRAYCQQSLFPSEIILARA